MKLKIGTRRSKLALWQSNLVAKKLNALDVQTELVEIESFGDKEQDLPLHKLGDKGVFTKALDEALLDGKIDLAVHSLKDVPTIFEDGLQLNAVLERANPIDVLVEPLNYKKGNTSRTIATGSIRRSAFWKNKYPEDEVVDLRGNVPTRLNKVDTLGWDGAIFAHAGLERLGLGERISKELPWMISAPSQGAIGIVSKEDFIYSEIVSVLNDDNTRICVDIERAFLRTLDAGCSSPVGALAEVKDGKLFFKGAVLSVDGKQRVDIKEEIELRNANETLGAEFAKKVINEGAADLLNGN
ncbi:MAG TPA: hydroxymethylbilane synthase [Balneola sp.]|nr:hydroxymethylbilane synthase [Bacteroidota bacterium]HCT51515.1 hydroxymethylbilane synthase [Balneola sp.]|tara:strand:- start:12 stop:905 length:894 start_codon:yes stop_codon:yes gene_type:complete